MSRSTATIETNLGNLTVEFFQEDAPETVKNFIKLSKEGFYDGVGFHRIIKGFMMQGGDPDGNGTGGPGYCIKDEFNDRPHQKGSLSMARTSAPNSAGSQFFICFQARPELDRQYTVFGQVTDGIDVVQKVEETAAIAGEGSPRAEVRMNKVTIVETEE